MGSKSRARLAKKARNRKSSLLARKNHKKSKSLKVAPVCSDQLEGPGSIFVPEIVEKPVNSESKEKIEQDEKPEEASPETLDAIDSGDKLPKNIGKTRRQTRLEDELEMMKLMIEEKESQVQNITKQLHCSEFKCQKLQEEVHKLQKLLRTRENEEVIVVKTEQEELPHFTDFLSEAEELDD